VVPISPYSSHAIGLCWRLSFTEINYFTITTLWLHYACQFNSIFISLIIQITYFRPWHNYGVNSLDVSNRLPDQVPDTNWLSSHDVLFCHSFFFTLNEVGFAFLICHVVKVQIDNHFPLSIQSHACPSPPVSNCVFQFCFYGFCHLSLYPSIKYVDSS